jgi:hypothetical protein
MHPYSPVHFFPQMFGRYPAGKLGDVVAQIELQPAGEFHPYILRLLNYRLSQSMATLIREISPPRPEPSHPPNLPPPRTQAPAKRSPRRGPPGL